MNDKLGFILAFVAGTAIGSVIAWKLADKKYKQISDEEIASVKEVYNRELKKVKDEQSKNEENTYVNIVDSLDYVANTYKKMKEEEDLADDAEVYVISPEAFGECGYETESLTYYADKVLVYNTTNEIITDVNGLVGRNSLNTFGEYEEDSVFVRNEIKKTDFEILLDVRNYSDVVKRKPHYIDDDDD